MNNILTEMLNCRYPVMSAGMAGVAYAELTGAVSKAGGFGVLGMANVPAAKLQEQIRKVKTITDNPFGVDLLAAVPESLERAVDIMIEENIHLFASGLGVPVGIMQRLKDANILVLCLCGTVQHAKRAEAAGADLVVAQGTEAGGHTGKVGGLALIPQIVDAVNIPVVAAGGIYDNRGLNASVALGACGVWVGTRFIATQEARAPLLYKQSILSTDESGTIVSKGYSGKSMRVIKNEYILDIESKPEQIQRFPEQYMQSINNNAISVLSDQEAPSALDTDKECLPAGQGSGGIFDIPTAAEIVMRLAKK